MTKTLDEGDDTDKMGRFNRLDRLSHPWVLALVITIISLILPYAGIAILSFSGIDVLGTKDISRGKSSPILSGLLMLTYLFLLYGYNLLFFRQMWQHLDKANRDANRDDHQHAFHAINAFTTVKKWYELSYLPFNILLGSLLSVLRHMAIGITDGSIIFGVFFRSIGFLSIALAITFVLTENLVTRVYLPLFTRHRTILIDNLKSWQPSLSVWFKMVIMGFSLILGFATLLSFEYIGKESNPLKLIAVSAFVMLAYLSVFIYYRTNSKKINSIVGELMTMAIATRVDLAKQLPLLSTDDMATLTIVQELLMHRIAIMIAELRQAGKIVHESAQQFQVSYEELRSMATEISSSINELTKNTQEISDLMARTQEVVTRIEKRLTEMEQNERRLTRQMQEATQMIRILAFNVTLEASRIHAPEAGGFLAITKQIEEFSSSIGAIYKQLSAMTDSFRKQVLTTVDELVAATETVNQDTNSIASQSEEISAMLEEELSSIEELENKLNELVELAGRLENLTKDMTSEEP